MDKHVLTYLFDILDSINEVDGYIANNRTYEYYCNNKILQRAVERNLEIIGEAMSRILKIDKSIPILNAKGIIDTRNKISHGYEQVDHTIIWGIIIKHFPILKSNVEELLEGN
jgi:uncharacterized protein with HEPN domain